MCPVLGVHRGDYVGVRSAGGCLPTGANPRVLQGVPMGVAVVS